MVEEENCDRYSKCHENPVHAHYQKTAVSTKCILVYNNDYHLQHIK